MSKTSDLVSELNSGSFMKHWLSILSKELPLIEITTISFVLNDFQYFNVRFFGFMLTYSVCTIVSMDKGINY